MHASVDPLCIFLCRGKKRANLLCAKTCANCVFCFGLCCIPVSLLQGRLFCNDPVAAPWGMSISARKKKITAPGLGIGSLDVLNDTVCVYKDLFVFYGVLCVFYYCFNLI